ncbi:MAG: dTDP-4-dehydrorhamnose 3,5-epimerase [candidate division WOR-3 bacterium]|nr:dTDP-4-dehydrorhamnose 3,5-epimerase [candidate division WOR-3 bacterium]MDW8151024.1 dTDP-4-dehydrorhamnose 3,5-epimerase [candidate division WOR-3 bacterium]
MKIVPLELEGVILFELDKYEDDRGYFMEVMREVNINVHFVQLNHSFSRKNVLRGIHFQRYPKEQAKFIKVITGKIFDVIVDYKNFRYISVELDENKALFIPKGYGHGFLALEDTNLIYLVDEYYNKEYEGGIIYSDEILSIPWPVDNPILSEKDKKLPRLPLKF